MSACSLKVGISVLAATAKTMAAGSGEGGLVRKPTETPPDVSLRAGFSAEVEPRSGSFGLTGAPRASAEQLSPPGLA
jgi:hypothetical protein